MLRGKDGKGFSHQSKRDNAAAVLSGMTIIARAPIDRWTALTIVGVGVFMAWGAGTYTVFDDEAFSCRQYVMPAGEMVSALWHGVEPDPPLYYLLENGWVRIFGVGPLGLRSLSILFFLAGLVFVRLAGRAWFDGRTGLVAMVLCALHPAHLFFGFAARWYSLMFLMVAVLLWLTARVTAARGRRRGLIIAWALAAAGACYTNYFGPVVVGLIWLAGVLRCRDGGGVKSLSQELSWHRPLACDETPARRRCHNFGIGSKRAWIWTGLLALVAFGPWVVPFCRQVGGFQTAGISWTACAATGARTTVALLTGNLASPAAWWVWAPMGVFGIGLIVLLVHHWRVAWPIAAVTFGCFAAGVASRTMIDKYIMTFSGAASLLVAALLVRGLRGARCEWRAANGEDQAADRLRRSANGQSSTAGGGGCGARREGGRVVALVTAACLVAGWIGCGVNLVRERHWSSLRWLDPFDRVIRGLAEATDSPPPGDWVMTHPAARYYHGCILAVRGKGGGRSATTRIDAGAWRRLAVLPTGTDRPRGGVAATPRSILKRMEAGPVPALITLETAGFVELPQWAALQGELNRSYRLTSERRHLEDPDAVWKDRLDPTVRHPPWRIVVCRWELRE